MHMRLKRDRELRVIINPGTLNDAETTVVAAKIRDEVS